jgi:LacI family transcriptional regulator
MALGAMVAVENKGLRVGADVAVAGFDDIPSAAAATPPLTTIRQPIYDIGCLLVTKLVHILRGTPLETDRTSIAPELVVRASSGSPRS